MGQELEQRRVLPIRASSAASAIALGILVDNLEAGKPIRFVPLGIELIKEGDEFVIRDFRTGEVIDGGELKVAPKLV